MSISDSATSEKSPHYPKHLLTELPSNDNYRNSAPQLLKEPRFCKISWGFSWVIRPFEMFKGNFLVWLAIGVILCLLSLISFYVPIFEIVLGAINAIIIGIIIVICAAQAENEDLDFTGLCRKIKAKLRPLIMLSILFIVGIVVALIPLLILFSSIYLTLALDIEAMKIKDFPIVPLTISVIVSLVLFILLLMAVWFAPALIVLHGLDPKSAMKKSLKGSLANMLPTIVYAVIIIILLQIFLKVTLGFGMIIAAPWIAMNYYISYRDVWTDQPITEWAI